MVCSSGTIFAEAATEFAYGQQSDLRAMGQPLKAIGKGSKSSREFAEHAAMARELVGMGVVAALSQLQHGRTGVTADQAQGEGHLPAETIAGNVQTRRQGRQRLANELELLQAGLFKAEHLAQHGIGADGCRVKSGGMAPAERSGRQLR